MNRVVVVADGLLTLTLTVNSWRRECCPQGWLTVDRHLPITHKHNEFILYCLRCWCRPAIVCHCRLKTSILNYSSVVVTSCQWSKISFYGIHGLLSFRDTRRICWKSCTLVTMRHPSENCDAQLPMVVKWRSGNWANWENLWQSLALRSENHPRSPLAPWMWPSNPWHIIVFILITQKTSRGTMSL